MATQYLVNFPFIDARDRLPTRRYFLSLCTIKSMIFTMLASFRTFHFDMLPICIPFRLFILGHVMFDVLPLTHVEFYLLNVSFE